MRLLQRGRALSSAEMLREADWKQGHDRRFNGAALFRARRFSLTKGQAKALALQRGRALSSAEMD